MEANQETIAALAQYLQQTMNQEKAIRKQAEDFLMQNEHVAGYAILLLSILDKENIDLNIRQAGAVRFKNFIKKHWCPDTETDIVPEQTRVVIKQNIVTLMVSSHPKIQAQISEAVSLISDSDYPEKWPSLMTDLVSKLSGGDLNVLKGVLITAGTIFKRYRNQFKSDELFTEINYSVEHFYPALGQVYQMVNQQVQANAQNLPVLKTYLSLLHDTFEIVHSLCWQDLPQVFEDDFKMWNGEMLKYLTYSNALALQDEVANEDETGPVTMVKTSVCGTINLFMSKFEEDFVPYVQEFVKVTWEMLTTTGLEKRNDSLIANALCYLTAVAKSTQHAFFGNQQVLEQICLKVVLPNMKLRDEDEELFEDSPSEYIQMDIEGSDTDTRRRTACELVKGLCKNYEQLVTTTFGGYVQQLITEYTSNPATGWKSKDAAIYLVIALAVKGGTYSLGTTELNTSIPIMTFFEQHIVPELQDPDVNKYPILKADAIKFTTTFRNQVTAQMVPVILPLIINHLKSKEYVVRSYAAGCVEKLLSVKDGNVLRFTGQLIQPFLQPLLSSLFEVLTIGMGGTDKWENEYTMKAILRVTGVAKGEMAPFVVPLLGQLNKVLECVCGNPRNPQFNHFLFETVASLIKFVCEANPAAVTQFEQVIMAPFQQVLVKEIDEFSPYVFQIFGQILELRSAPLPADYNTLFGGILTAALWERQGNVPALNLLLVAFIHKAPEMVATQLEPVLGIFQRLISSKSLDHEGMNLFTNLFQSLPMAAIQDKVVMAFQVMLMRLQGSPTVKFKRALIRSMSLFVHQHGYAMLEQVLNQIQPGMIDQLLANVWLPEVQAISGFNNRKCVGVGLVKMLETPEVQAKPQVWMQILTATLKLIDLPPTKEDGAEDALGTEGFDNAFSKLQYAGSSAPVFETQLPETQAALVQAHKSIMQCRSFLVQLPEADQAKLQGYFQSAGVQLA